MSIFVQVAVAALRAALLAVALTSAAQGQVPNLINYQGFVAVDGASFSGSGAFRFALVNAGGSTTLWSNDGSSVAGSQPTNAVTLAVSGGVFNVVLGDAAIANMTAIPASVFTGNGDVRLRVWFDDATHGVQLLAPDQRVVAAAYAIRAGSADALAAAASVPAAQITGTFASAQISDGSVTKPKLSASGGSAGQVLGTDGTSLHWQSAGGAGTVTQVNTGTGLTGGPITASGTISVAAGGITATELAANAVTTAKLADTTVTLAKLNNMGCSATQILKYNGTAWACAPDNTGPANAFVQNGNGFGAEAVLGTTDNFALDVRAGGSRVMRYEPNAISPNVIGGSPANNVTVGVRGATIGGGGLPVGDVDPDFGLQGPNRVTDIYGTVGGGLNNVAGDGAGTVANRAVATVGGGMLNAASGFASTVAGGESNHASANNSTVSGGRLNNASETVSTVAGGIGNVASGINSTVAGGGSNTASGEASIVVGGFSNTASGDFSFAAGRSAKTQNAAGTAIYNGAFVWADSQVPIFNGTAIDEFSARAGGGFRFVTEIDGAGSPTRLMRITPAGDVGINVAPATPIDANLVVRDGSPVVILRGTAGNTSSRLRFEESPAANDCAGGYLFHDGATNFFEIGVNNAFGAGACVPADDLRGLQIHRATGRVGVLTTFTGTPTHPLTVGDGATNGNGAHVTAGGVWTNGSSRSFKENFVPVDALALLDRLLALPISEWSYRGEAGDRHLGPVAEDFKAAFRLGGDERYIGTVDADGVALAAIQGLNAKLEAKVAEQARELAAERAAREAQERDIAELRRTVEVLLARTAPELTLVRR